MYDTDVETWDSRRYHHLRTLVRMWTFAWALFHGEREWFVGGTDRDLDLYEH
jgi:hypothetical protein